MKTTIRLYIAAALFAVFHICKAAEPPKPPVKQQANFLEAISWGTVGAVRNVDITDHADHGVGLELELPVNKFINLRAVGLAYEDNNWAGSAIDEVGLGIKANLVRTLGERLHLYATGTGYRDFEHEDWGFGTGLGLTYHFNPAAKHFKVSLSGGTEVRAWFDQSKDLLTTLSLNIRP